MRVGFLAGWLPCWERASHCALRVCCRKMFCYVSVFSVQPGVYVGYLNLIASIPGSFIILILLVWPIEG